MTLILNKSHLPHDLEFLRSNRNVKLVCHKNWVTVLTEAVMLVLLSCAIKLVLPTVPSQPRSQHGVEVGSSRSSPGPNKKATRHWF